MLQGAKNEEEEFNTGPLSVLMMSVKNNTQVMLSENLMVLCLERLYISRASILIQFGSCRANRCSSIAVTTESFLAV